jgi:ATP-dependent DNA helicase DinG
MQTTERFTAEAIDTLREAISDAHGNEVFVAGKLDEHGLVATIIVAARGGKTSVPAISGFLDRGDVLIHNHPSGVIEPSEADLAVAARVGEQGVGTYIVDDQVTTVYVIAEPVRSRSLIALDPEELARVLMAGGKLAARLPGYEARESQLELVRSICDALNNGYVLAAEAGTGVGKSFAYLIPAFAWAARNKERVVLSTATINLQRQLMDKDIPLVASLFRKPMKAVLVKGRGNYLCRTRLLEALDEEGLFAGPDHPLRRIAEWAEASPNGDRADLSFWPEDAVWSRVCSETDECLGLRCPYRENCFVLKVKREAADADVLVANHHILFSDLAARASGAGYGQTAVLPPFNAVVLDEAHAIESSATSFFAADLSRFMVYRQLAKLYRERRGRKFGVLVKLQNIKGLPADVLKQFPLATDALREAMAAADSAALSILGNAQSLRLVAPNAAVERCVMEPLGLLERQLLAIIELLRRALESIPEDCADQQAVQEADLAVHRLGDMSAFCGRFRRFADDQESVFWLERCRTGQGESFVRFNITPVDISRMMNEALFEPFRTTVCLSATLSVGRSFEFWKSRTGLALADVRSECLVFPSPFPYDRNALFCAPNDAPLPDNAAWQGWINDQVYRLIEASGGRALILFTSYTVLRACWEAVKPRLEILGISAYRQGDDERFRLLEQFKTDVASVLFATDSFWEGVDAPGETLELVVITKLPFRVPTDPVQQARAEAVERRGGNAFMDLSLPEAVIRLKQGFGRLIRHSDDRGAVVVLDARLLGKRYGQLFITSLPGGRHCFGPMAGVLETIGSFLRRPTPFAPRQPEQDGLVVAMDRIDQDTATASRP